MKRTSTLVSPLAAAVLLLGACGQGPDEAPPDAATERYLVRLAPVNGSGARGTATLSLSGERLRVGIRATGVAPERIHPQELFGATQTGAPARCPSAEADVDADGLVGVAEAEAEYGLSVRHLEPYPTVGADGELDYEHASKVDPENVEPLEERVLVLHGLDVGPTDRGTADGYEPDVPVACGPLVRVRP